jgi:hypothetical protein
LVKYWRRQRDVARDGSDRLLDAVTEAAWIQWGSLGSFVSSKRVARSVIDPEALLLMSLCLRDRERRLWEVVGSWAENGSRLFSVQRVKNLHRRFPRLIDSRLTEFAALALRAGKDHRWRSMANSDAGPPVRNPGLWEAYPPEWEPAALMVRLRLGIGVGVGADLLSFLIALRGDWAGAPAIADATDYSVYSIRRAADNMVGAQLLERTSDKPVRYRADSEAWRRLLGIDPDLPRWHFWAQIYSLAATLFSLDETQDWKNKSPYMISSALRDLVEEHEDAFILNIVNASNPKRFPGQQYTSAFQSSITRLAQWTLDHV